MIKMSEDNIKLAKLETFVYELDGKKFEQGTFAWSGNYILKIRVDSEKKKVYATLYYANMEYRIEKHKKKKEKEKQENSNPFATSK